jgi:hypothetical protein
VCHGNAAALARTYLAVWNETGDPSALSRRFWHDDIDNLADYTFFIGGCRLGGFAVTYAFEVSKDDQTRRVKQAFSELAEVLSGEKFGGRIYLVKNECATTETLRKMYGENAAAFLRLRRELDPAGILRNDFLEKTFGAPTPA